MLSANVHSNLTELQAYAGLISDNETVFATDQTVEKLDYHGISLLALERGSLNKMMCEQLGSRRAMMVANEAMKKSALCELFTEFNAAGLNKHLLFKGTALAYSVYPKPWLRPRSDSDCLIDIGDFPAFQAVFKKLGYEEMFAIKGKYVSYQTTFFKALSKHTFINVDLHWKISNRQVLADTFNLEELFASKRCAQNLVESANIPHPVDSAIIACVHRLGHHHLEERVIWLYDIHRLVAEFTHQDWDNFVQKARLKRIAAITLDALVLCNRLFASQIPSGTLSQLQMAAENYEPSQLFLQRDLAEWHYFVNDLKSLPRWRDRFGLLRETLFPAPQYMRQKMQTNSLLLAYTRRGVRGLQRISRSNKN